MRTFHDCLPCFVRQTLDAARMSAPGDETLCERVLRRVLGLLAEMDLARSPPEMAQEIHRILRAESGCADPYAGVKQRFNDLARSMMPALRGRLERAEDPYVAAVRLALAGNIIDFGTRSALDEREVEETVERSMHEPIHGSTIDRLREATDAAGSIAYVGDNAGELFFDRLFIERLGPDRITFVVRGAPVINDATRDDAREAGLDELVRVIDTGSDAPGALLSQAGADFQAALDEAELVISKGQGNYETLSDLARPVFFLLRAKCPVIAAHIGVPEGTLVLEGRNL
ncbi:MAG: DUF89 family protein [Deltaproteobacteria bacterium]|nr:DUF89 family protein [Deltaproteobacteria bacterium]